MSTSTGIRLALLNSIVERLMPLVTDAPVLADGEFGLEAETGKLKLGDGTTPWGSLPYFTGGGGSGAADALTIGGVDFPIGAVADGQVLTRSGGDIVGTTPAGGITGSATTTDDSTPQTLATIPLALHTNYVITVLLVGRETVVGGVGSVGDVITSLLVIAAKRIAGNAVVASNQVDTGVYNFAETLGPASFQGVASGTDVLIQVEGIEATTTVEWKAAITMVQV